jgi:DNA-binding PadR family transcriptional regulator
LHILDAVEDMKVPRWGVYDFFDYNRHTMKQDPYALLPLRPVAYQVLLALADGERHGYGIVQDISQRTAARMTLEPGNLYRTLKWMLDQELIEESDRRPAPDLDDERRRYYRITRFGWRVGVAETARLEALVTEAKTKRWSPR